MSKIFLFLIITASLGSLSAQNFIGKINPYPDYSYRLSSRKDTLKILAVMVSFQEDKDDATFGNGKFGSIYSQNYGLSIIDPVPHDKEYFEAHLQFAKNYFEKVSNRKQNISFYVLPDTILVSKTMRNYSPPANSNDFTALGDFSKEVWTKAGEQNPGFNFKDYDIFLIFHAGVGRDISLPGSVGDERDLPSIYLSFKALKAIYGQDFAGFPIGNNSYNITNSMVIPETESREISSVAGSALIEISINGLIVSSIASYLGLPDLFDTETGKSAIGKFGLMDGQAIFAYNGLFPPEPSAWEKIFLGWSEPVTIKPGNYNIDLAANLAASGNDTTILKVPINSTEYYLLENRNRDAHKDGARIKYISGGDTLTKVFEKDTSGFYSFDTDSLQGVIIDVDEFDWAVPGNGIVIWHIDDNIIDSKIAENKINTDKQHRGVGVVEADGIQDIGEEYQDIFGDIVVGEGAPEDFWYSSNPSRFYKNKFGKDTRPASTTNAGANSLITISNFSDYMNKMSFNISYGDSIVKPIFIQKLKIPANIKGLTNTSTQSEMSFDIISGSSLYRINQDTTELILNNFSLSKTASFVFEGKQYSIGMNRDSLNVFSHSDKKILTFVPGNEISTAYPVVNLFEYNVLIGISSGTLINNHIIFPFFNMQQDSITNIVNEPIKLIAADDGFWFTATEDKIFLEPDGISDNLSSISDIALTKDKNGDYVTIVLHNNNEIKVKNWINGDEKNFIISSIDSLSAFSLADLKNNGGNYILFANNNNLDAINLQGAEADNFPFKDPLGIGFIGTPLSADFTGDSKSEVIAYTKDGRIFAIDGGTGKVVDGFPFSTGAELATVPVLFNYQGKTLLAAVDVKNNLYVWDISSTEGKLFWSEAYGSSYNNSFVGSAVNNSPVNEFFPKEKAYNYPNPVYGDETNIHYYVDEDSKVNIKIFDLAGDFVAELNDNAKGGFDNETIWKVSSIQSGVYLARIEATGSSGKTESNIIKIAVIK